MSSNAKIVLRKRKNKQGLFPMAIRITHNRKSNYHYIGHYIELKFWDEVNKRVKKSHPNASRLNNLLTAKLAEANRTLIVLQSEKKDISAFQIKKEIYASNENVSFFDVAGDFLKELEHNNKLSRLTSDKVRVNHVLSFTKSKQLTFQEINESFLKRFMLYLKNKQRLSERSIVNNLVVIRTIYNRAIKMGIVDRKLYPFGSNKIRVKFPETNKIGLTIEEVQRIENLVNLTEEEKYVKNVWLFSFYLAGIRIADVLKIKWSDIYDGRIHYRMNKNSKLLSLKLPDKIIPILEVFKKDKRFEDDFIFPELKKADANNPKDIYAKTRTANKKFNDILSQVAVKAKITKKLTMHIARHSFGNIAGDQIPIQMLQKLYRHSTITTTMYYQANFINSETDKALEKVVNF